MVPTGRRMSERGYPAEQPDFLVVCWDCQPAGVFSRVARMLTISHNAVAMYTPSTMSAAFMLPPCHVSMMVRLEMRPMLATAKRMAAERVVRLLSASSLLACLQASNHGQSSSLPVFTSLEWEGFEAGAFRRQSATSHTVYCHSTCD